MLKQSKIAAARRDAFSLIEVIIALFIFMISFVAVFELINIGSDRAMDTQAISQASLLCQSKMNELVVGAEPMTPMDFTAFDDNPSFQYKIDAEEGEFDFLWNVVVHVRYQPEGRDKALEVTLAQMIVDPSIRGSTLEPLPVASTDNTPPDTTTTGATTGTTGTTGATGGMGG